MQTDTTIMVVEDETLLLQAITKKLKVSGLDVVSCASGQQALDYLSSMDKLPSAVWLDYYLKDMNGLAFMQTIKENPKWTNIPVVVVSNSASPEKVKNMLALGAKRYILKAEYRLDEIIQMMRDLIAEASDSGADSAATARLDGASAETPAAASGSPASPTDSNASTPPADPTPPTDPA